MTITEFLLTRIAEDEIVAQLRQERHERVEPSAMSVMYGRTHFAADPTSPVRLLAECDAKRRIVEIHQPLPDDPEPFCWNCDEESWPCKTMAALALPYAEHPEYRDEWRP